MQIPEMQKKIEEIFLDFQIIAFELVSLKTRFFTGREYLSSGVNMLTNSLNIIDTTKTEILELIFFQSDKKKCQKTCRPDLSTVWNPLTC